MKQKTVGELTQVLSKELGLTGSLKIKHQFKDGSSLVAEVIRTRDGERNKRFFKVTDEDIKIGNFMKGRFHYSTSRTLNFN